MQRGGGAYDRQQQQQKGGDEGEDDEKQTVRNLRLRSPHRRLQHSPRRRQTDLGHYFAHLINRAVTCKFAFIWRLMMHGALHLPLQVL